MKIKKEASLMEGIVFALIVSAILRATGGIRSLSTFGQILVLIMMPIVVFVIVKANKKKFSKFQLHYLYIFDILFSIAMLIAVSIVIIRESYDYIWIENIIFFKILIVLAAFVPTTYLAVCSIIDPDIKRTWR
ncbi:hypothetical protein IAI10_06135 [Clostridium sp. 19966]|uniref:hypothetical protein n=1 Tax=Clostridium sp. 19966 TaxID=2768166 RepID=UPI0028DEFEDE|nr:hypothetical protein [Clostridium sp. 19966]MDT8716229.1 hypothetical protein [Clostridium sp. 19966]